MEIEYININQLIIKWFLLLRIWQFQNLSTAVEQAVECAPITQQTRVRSPVGTSFLGEVFFGVFPHL